MVLLSFLATVRDMGAGGYMVQEKDLTPEKVRAVWAVQLGIGVFLGLLVLVGSTFVAKFYNEPRIQYIMVVVALNYAINPFGSLTYAWQIRQMRFDALALVRFSATSTGALVSVYLAWRGFGPISLAFGALGSTVVNAAMAIYFRPKWFPWLPGLKELKQVLAYGSRTTGTSIIQTVAENTSELLLAKFQSMSATGLYSRASGLVMMFDRVILSGISSVATPWFAQKSREGGGISDSYLRAISYVTAIGWPFSFGLIFLAHPAMRLLYGKQWDGAVELTRLMGIALAVGMPAMMIAPAIMATGNAASLLRGTVITAIITIALMATGALHSLQTLGYCLILASMLRALYWTWISHRVVRFQWSALASTLLRSAVVGIGGGLAPIAVYLTYGPRPDSVLAPLIIGVLGAACGALISVLLIKHPLRTELMMLIDRLRK